jgi:hypothetical protein
LFVADIFQPVHSLCLSKKRRKKTVTFLQGTLLCRELFLNGDVGHGRGRHKVFYGPLGKGDCTPTR